MSTHHVHTEDPDAEQWRLLNQFTYAANVDRALVANGFPGADDELAEFITGSVRQGASYFTAAASAPLDISPVLVYYGLTHLLAAAFGLANGKVPAISNHGMALTVGTASGTILKSAVTLESFPNGMLRTMWDFLNPDEPFPPPEPWSLEEVAASLPDLKQELTRLLPNHRSYVVLPESRRDANIEFQRIPVVQFTGVADPIAALKAVRGFDKAFLEPKLGGSGRYVVLYRRLQGVELGEYGLSGEHCLLLSHEKQGRRIAMPQLLSLVVGLFALGHICRYHSTVWTPFLRLDQTGERLVVEQFLALAHRFAPNLVLNAMLERRVAFVFRSPVPSGRRRR